MSKSTLQDSSWQKSIGGHDALSNDTSNSPQFIVIPSQQQVASTGGNEQGTTLSTSSQPIDNRLLDLYKFNSFQRLNA